MEPCKVEMSPNHSSYWLDAFHTVHCKGVIIRENMYPEDKLVHAEPVHTSYL